MPSLSIVDSTIANNAAGDGGNGAVGGPHAPVGDPAPYTFKPRQR